MALFRAAKNIEKNDLIFTSKNKQNQFCVYLEKLGHNTGNQIEFRILSD